MAKNIINDIPQKEAETKTERLLLGLIKQEADALEFGDIVMEINIRGGEMDRVRVTKTSKVVNIGMRDGRKTH